ncbi:MAG: extracellular solute-binding protein [bacterium]|nr:extracellular solute-binding protein [bacterium]
MNIINIKKLIVALAVVALAAVLYIRFSPAGLAGFKFNFPGQKKVETVTLKYWGLWESENVMKVIFDDYQRLNPNVKIEYKMQTPRDYRERLQSALEKNVGPDIFRFHNSWAPMFRDFLAIIPETVMDEKTFRERFYPAAFSDLKTSFGIAGIPLGMDGLALYYNEELVKSAGVAVPKTWDELKEAAKKITKREDGRIKTAGVSLGTTNNVDHWPDILALMILQNGGDLKNPATSWTEEAALYYVFFNTEDHVWNETFDASTLAFSQGKVAFYFAPSWRAFEIRALNPGLQFKIAPVPQLAEQTINWASYWVEGVSRRSTNQAEAWKLLTYLVNPDTLRKFYAEAAKTRLFGEPPSRRDMGDSFKEDPLVGPFVSQAETAKSGFLSSRTFDNGLNDKVIKYYEDALNSILAGNSAKSAMETCAKGVGQVIADYGIK